jgi:hypothetical protein
MPSQLAILCCGQQISQEMDFKGPQFCCGRCREHQSRKSQKVIASTASAFRRSGKGDSPPSASFANSGAGAERNVFDNIARIAKALQLNRGPARG